MMTSTKLLLETISEKWNPLYFGSFPLYTGFLINH